VNADIYIVEVATGVETRLTTEIEPDSDPAWSPDGARLAFDSRRVGGQRDLWVLEPGGSFTRLTDDARDDAYPTWSPDGTEIAWAAGPSGSREIWVADARDGSGAKRVTSGHDDLFPAWSSTGLIAFQRRAGSQWEVWVVRPDGSGPVVRISVGDGGGSNPAWSPDGKRFAFVRPVAGVNRIFIVDANGSSDLVELTRGDACDCELPTWSPDGTQIAYVGPRGTIRPIMIISAKGGTARRVTANGLTPFWGT
jgi:Tol biopolymer transport system component